MIRACLCAAAALLISSAAFSDMIEVRGKGVMNGKLVAQTEQEMTFVDVEGKTVRIPRSDVLFFESDGEAVPITAAGQKPEPKKFKMPTWADITATVRHQSKEVGYWFRRLQKQTDRWTQKFRDTAGKPLDRSVANKKSAMANKVTEAAADSHARFAKSQKHAAKPARAPQEGGDKDSDGGKKGWDGDFGRL